MAIISHIATPEDIANVKALEEQNAKLSGRPQRPVFSKKFPGDKVQFLYTWLTHDRYQSIVGNKSYIDQLEKNPQAAKRFLDASIMQDCVLWPVDFNPLLAENLQPYPAGVIDGLVEAVLFSSGFTQDAAPDSVINLPDAPTEPTPEEIAELMKKHELGKRFGVSFGKPFFLRDFDFDTGDYKLIPTRYYFYTQLDRKTFNDCSQMSDDAAMLHVLNACVLWPQNIDWLKEPANYGEWLFRSIMVQSGFGSDPSAGLEEV